MVSYSNVINQPIADRIILIQIDLGKEQGKWDNYQAGVWFYSWTINQNRVNIGDNPIGVGNIGQGDYKNYISIGSCFVDGAEYTEKTSLSDCISTEQSWYFDSANFKLYIHNEKGREPQLYDIIIGLTMGLSNKAVYLDNLYYEPRLTGLPTISKSKDLFYFGILKFEGGEFEFDNADGFFDNITDNYIFGQPVRVYHGGDGLSFSEYQQVYAGYIESVSMDYEKFTISVADNRKKLSTNIIQNTFSQSDYTYLKADNEGKPIPIVYGEAYHCKVICVNETQSGADWVFKVCDVTGHSNGINDITNAYKSDGSSLTIKSKDLTNGTFTVANADWDGTGDVYCDIEGLKDSSGNYLQNPLDIIKDILSVYAGIDYNSDNYDTTEWASATSHDLANNIGVFIDSDIEISKVIEQICNSVFGFFVVLDDGRYSFKIIDETASSGATININEMSKQINIDWEGTQYLSSCKVGYKKDYNEKEFRWFINKDYETEVYNKYKVKYDKTFETLLTNSGDAEELADTIMAYYKDIRPIYTITTTIKVMLLDVGDMVTLEIGREDKDIMGYVKAEIIGISKDLLNETITLTCRYVEDVS